MYFLGKIEKWPKKNQWKYFFRVFSPKEKIAFFVFLITFFGSIVFLVNNFYTTNTEEKPTEGGTYIEGLVGQPRFLNPVYANSDIDRDISQLIFSGLMKYNEKMEIVPDLAQNFEILDDGKTYKFYLKENIVWEDKFPVTADDIIYTIKTIQNPNFKSPYRANWVGVEVEKLNDLSIQFKLKKAYSSFLENCTLKILPKHIWKDIEPERVAFDVHNLQPIGSGPYKIKEVRQEKSERVSYIILKKNAYYSGTEAHISEIKFIFFDDEKTLLKSAQQGKIKAFSPESIIDPDKRWISYHISMPRYFSLFLNQEEPGVLANKEVKNALQYATNKRAVTAKALNLPENSPLIDKFVNGTPVLAAFYGLPNPSVSYEFSVDKAKELLDAAGYKDTNNDGVREKTTNKKPTFQLKTDLRLNSQGTEVEELQKCLAKFPEFLSESDVTGKYGKKTEEAVMKFQEKYADEILKPAGTDTPTGEVGKGTRKKLNEFCFSSSTESQVLQFTLTTVDQPQLVKVAEEIQKEWQEINVKIIINKLPISQIEQDYIKPREYEILLFGEVLGAYPDPFPFWHSSQKKDPGLNLTSYQNKDADKLLEDIRTSFDAEARAKKLAELQEIIITDSPAIFLYSPEYLYIVSKDVHGINLEKLVDPSKRFNSIENWFIKTKRIWK